MQSYGGYYLWLEIDIWALSFKHIYHKANNYADGLANLAFDHDLGIVYYDHSLDKCNSLVFTNMMGTLLPNMH